MAEIQTNVNALNAIRSAASPSYQDLVPLATASNLQDVGNPILQYAAVRNEFLTLLVNKIALPIVRSRMFRNPLAMLRREGSPLAYDEEEIGVNPAKAEDFDATSTDLLAQETPDVKVAYHRMNRQQRYKCTVQFAVLRSGFTTWGGFDRLVDEIVQSLYNGNYIDEFKYTKSLLGAGAIGSNPTMKTIAVAAPNTEANARSFVAAARSAFNAFLFPSTEFNSWHRAGGSGAEYTSWSDKNKIMFFIRSDISAYIDVEVLARAFNLDKSDFMGRVVIVPDFGDADGAENIYAVMCDERYPVILNKLMTVEEFRNGSNLSTNYYLHVWQTYSTSPLENAVAFVGATDLSALTVGAVATDFDFWGTPASAIQENIAVTGSKITGTLKYVDSGQIVTDWGAGNFLGLKFTNIDADATSVLVGLEPSVSSGLQELINDPDKAGIFKITDKSVQKLKVIQSNGNYSRVQTFDLSELVTESE